MDGYEVPAHLRSEKIERLTTAASGDLQEIANVAMGRSSDLPARLLGIFVRQPIPKVAFIASSELHMTIAAATARW